MHRDVANNIFCHESIEVFINLSIHPSTFTEYSFLFILHQINLTFNKKKKKMVYYYSLNVNDISSYKLVHSFWVGEFHSGFGKH